MRGLRWRGLRPPARAGGGRGELDPALGRDGPHRRRCAPGPCRPVRTSGDVQGCPGALVDDALEARVRSRGVEAQLGGARGDGPVGAASSTAAPGSAARAQPAARPAAPSPSPAARPRGSRACRRQRGHVRSRRAHRRAPPRAHPTPAPRTAAAARPCAPARPPGLRPRGARRSSRPAPAATDGPTYSSPMIPRGDTSNAAPAGAPPRRAAARGSAPGTRKALGCSHVTRYSPARAAISGQRPVAPGSAAAAPTGAPAAERRATLTTLASWNASTAPPAAAGARAARWNAVSDATVATCV